MLRVFSNIRWCMYQVTTIIIALRHMLSKAQNKYIRSLTHQKFRISIHSHLMETHFNQTTHIHSWTGRWPVAAEPSAICITRFILHLFRTFFHSPVTTSELSLSSVSSLTFSTPISQKALPCYYFFLLSFSWFVFSFSASLSLIVMLLLFLFLVSWVSIPF